jgi:hypothetical protein
MLEHPSVALAPDPEPVSQWYRVTFRRRYGGGFRRQEEEALIQAMDAADVQTKISAIPGQVGGWTRAKLHECCVCRKTAPWDAGWGWYGSMQQIDDGDPVIKWCSDQCMASAKSARIIPRNAQNLDEALNA